MQTSQITTKVEYKAIGQEEVGQRLDNYLARTLKGVPRSLIYRILRKGEVRVNKKRVEPSYKLQLDDQIRIPPVKVSATDVKVPSTNLQIVQNIKNNILFENEQIFVVNKPCAIASHGGSGIEFGLIEALRALFPQYPFLELAHRLDRETSGCLIIAKRRSALRDLHEQFRQRIVKKRYLTLVPGRWDKKLKLVQAPLIRNQLKSGERMVEVNFKQGAPSSTGFELVEYLKGASLIQAMPHTGRTHQIRVHTAYVNHPVGGDEKYGDPVFNKYLKEHGLHRMFLHSNKIIFNDPQSHELLKITAPLPDELQLVVDNLKND